MAIAPERLPRTFRYVSRTKIESYYAQIDSLTRRALAHKLGLEFLDLDRPANETALFGRLKMVHAWLEALGQVGSADDARPFFRGTLSMGFSFLTHSDSQIALFGGAHQPKAGPRLVVCLGGSQRHVMGGGYADRALGSLPGTLYEVLASMAASQDREPNHDRRSEVLEGVCAAVRGLGNWPFESTEFLARRVLAGDLRESEPFVRDPDWEACGGQLRVILGTPLYVAAL